MITARDKSGRPQWLEIFQAAVECLRPVGDGHAEGLLVLRLVEHAVVRARGLVLVGGAEDGVDLAADGVVVQEVVLPMYLDGEVEPRAHALVGEVVDARVPFGCLDNGEDSRREVSRVGGRADLVEDDTQSVALQAQANHSLHEVVAVGRIEPCGAEYDRVGAMREQSLFACQFGATVGSARRNGVALAAGNPALTGEDVVGADVDDLGTCRGKVLHGVGIDEQRGRFVLLRLVHVGVGGAVDNQVNSMVAHKGMHRLAVGDVKFRHVGEEIGMVAVACRERAHLRAELSVGACD